MTSDRVSTGPGIADLGASGSDPENRPRRISSPKLLGSASWYPYYAGYSETFVQDVLDVSGSDPAAMHLLDPWNGSGTTTSVARRAGVSTVTGFDLNPALVIVAKARNVDTNTLNKSLEPIARDIVRHAKRLSPRIPSSPGFLDLWLTAETARTVRALMSAATTLVSDSAAHMPGRIVAVDDVNPLRAFFTLAMFDVVRRLTASLRTTNPTWVRRSTQDRISADPDAVRDAFTTAVQMLGERLDHTAVKDVKLRIDLADSKQLPLDDQLVDAVISSPPYLTRIDYAIAMLPELAVLEYGPESVGSLRAAMLGTPLTGRTATTWQSTLSVTVERTLAAVKRHKSVASTGYYYRFFANYFSGLEASMSEIARVTKSNAWCVLVVQDSYYKEHRVALPDMVSEMGESLGWSVITRIPFASRTRAAGHHWRTRYRTSSTATEEAIVLGRGSLEGTWT